MGADDRRCEYRIVERCRDGEHWFVAEYRAPGWFSGWDYAGTTKVLKGGGSANIATRFPTEAKAREWCTEHARVRGGEFERVINLGKLPATGGGYG